VVLEGEGVLLAGDRKDWIFVSDAHFTGRDPGEMEPFLRFLETEKERIDHFVILGDLFESSNKLPEAVFEYKEAVKLAPADAGFYLVLGKAYLKMDQDELALESFKKASLIAGDNKEMHEGLLLAFKELKINTLVREENEALARIARKESFMKSLGTKPKLKTE
jgi:UDP-2,3-diacylglucosamine pyrophosphatase LpxH